MGKAFGILVIVVGVWVGAEIYTQGVEGAFGGLFAGFVAPAASDEGEPDPYRWTGERAGESVGRAHDESEARRRQMLGE
jgi:hypothetical protein